MRKEIDQDIIEKKPTQITPEEEPELRRSVFDSLKNQKPVAVMDAGETVICDWCGKDYTDPPESEKCGGLLFGSKACCPECAPRVAIAAKEHNEENYIKGTCPIGVTFKNWVLKLRGGDNTIKLYTF